MKIKRLCKTDNSQNINNKRYNNDYKKTTKNYKNIKIVKTKE